MPEYDKHSINTEGVASVGELNTRVFREALTVPDYREAMRSGAVKAYSEISNWCRERISRAGPYDDMRAVQELLEVLGDRIRDVRSKDVTGDNPL